MNNRLLSSETTMLHGEEGQNGGGGEHLGSQLSRCRGLTADYGLRELKGTINRSTQGSVNSISNILSIYFV